MNALKSFLLDETSKKRENWLLRYWPAFPTTIIGLFLIFTVKAQNAGTKSFTLTPPSGVIANCLQNANARITVFPKEDLRGVETLDLKAEGLPAKTEFTVFLTERPANPFGAAEYIGDFSTNAVGRGSMRTDAIVDGAFAITVEGGVPVRKDLNHVVIWFADPNADDFCFAPGGTGPKTPFDGDGEAGATALTSGNLRALR